MKGVKSLIDTEDKPVLYQNNLTGKDPGFTTHPVPFVNGCEKSYRIGKRTFNYIDYMEAWAGISCYTYRSEDSLWKIRKEIQAAFDEIDEILSQQNSKKK